MTKLAALIMTVATLSASNAFADRVLAKDKDWTLTETSSGVCVAHAKSIGNIRGEYGTLQVISKKGARNLIEIMIRTDKKQSAHAGYTLRNDENNQASGKFAAINVAQDGATYWMIPQDTSNFIKIMTSTKQLDAASVGGAGNTRFSFSTKGLATMIGELKAQCLENIGASNANYEADFFSRAIEADISRLTVENAKIMRSTFMNGLKLHLDKRASRAELAEIRKRYQAAADEYDQTNVLIKELTARTIPTLLSQIKTQVDLRAAAEVELPKRRSEIPVLQRIAEAAKAHMERMEAIVAPIRGEYEMRTDSLERAQEDLYQTEMQLSQVRKEISKSEIEIRDLENEVSDLHRRIPQISYDLSIARSAHQRAENALRRFDKQGELARERRLPQNVNGTMITYDQAVRDVDSQRPEVNRFESDLINRRGDLSRAEAALKQCQATPGSACESELSAVNSAKIAVNLAQEQARSSRNELERRQEILEKVNKSINKKIDRIEDELRDDERQTRNLRDSLESRLLEANNRVNTIMNYELPSRRSLLSSQRSQERSLENLMYRQRGDVSARARELAEFKARTDWDSKKSNLDSATIDYNQKARTLSNVVARERELVQIIEFAKTEQPRLEAVLADKRALLDRSTARVAELKIQIQPYLDAKAASDAVVASLDAQLADLRAQYEAATK